MKNRKALFSTFVGALLLISLIVPVSASISPTDLTAELAPGESITETKTVTIPTVPPRADVVFAFDLTASMEGIISTAKARAVDITTALDALPGVDIQYGVMSYMDYPGYYYSCGYSDTYGSAARGDYAYSLDQAVTDNSTAVINAISGLTLGWGADGPQDYTRIMYESYAELVGETNPTYGPVGWRSGAKRILVNFGDNVPHDCNLNEGVKSGTWTTGCDPGRDEGAGTSDDLDLQTVLADMATNGVVLLECHTSSYASTHWTYWTGLTGGGLYITGSSTLVDDIVAAVQDALEVPMVYDLHLEASTGFESWLYSVSPASYASVVPGDIVSFEATIRVPDGTPDGVYNFAISAVDGVGVSYGDQNVTITVVSNQPPTANPNGPYTGSEGSLVAFDGTGSSDPDGDPLTYDWDFGDGNTGTGPTPNHTYADNGTYNVCLTVSDGDLSGIQCTTAEIANIAPTVGPITAPTDPVQVGTPINASAGFSDPGTSDTHTAVWDWGDGTTDTIDPATSPTSASHTYADAGIYTVILTVTDDDGDSDTSEFRYVVVYDPSAGFVTGGGWIDSPPGACNFDACTYDTTGKANFSFVSKYKKGVETPTGSTEFQFHADNLNFHSDAYEWLVIAGATAKFKGTGTINGSGNYGFMLSAKDENLTPSTDVDMFRIKIWDKDNGDAIVYDNEMSEEDDADPTTGIAGGSIVVHTGKK